LAQLRRVSETGDYYLALFGALAVPSICGALESPDGEDTADRYAGWFDQYIGPKYRVGPRHEPSLSGRQCYKFRCAMLHQGRMTHADLGYARILFIEPGSGFIAHNNVINDALNLDVQRFCQDMIDGTLQWLSAVEGTEPYETNLKQAVQRHPDGLPPYIVGVPVIS